MCNRRRDAVQVAKRVFINPNKGRTSEIDLDQKAGVSYYYHFHQKDKKFKGAHIWYMYK